MNAHSAKARVWAALAHLCVQEVSSPPDPIRPAPSHVLHGVHADLKPVPALVVHDGLRWPFACHTRAHLRAVLFRAQPNCAECTGYSGPFCAVCLRDEESVYFKSATGECQLCEEGIGPLMPAIIALGAIVLIALSLLACGCIVRREARKMRKKGRVSRADRARGWLSLWIPKVQKWKTKMMGRLRIMIALYQVLGALPSTFSVNFPSQYSTVMTYTSILQLDIFGMVPVECKSRTVECRFWHGPCRV